MNWIKFREQLPNSGDLIMVYDPSPPYCKSLSSSSSTLCFKKHHYIICRYNIIEHFEEIVSECESSYFQYCLSEIDFNEYDLYWMPLPVKPNDLLNLQKED